MAADPLPLARKPPHPFMSATALNEAMASLGIAGVHFSPVEGDPWQVGISHDMPPAQLVRLLLANLSAAHVHRQEQAALLDELADLLGRRPALQPDDGRIAAILTELRHLVRCPLLAQRTDRAADPWECACAPRASRPSPPG